MENEAGKKRGNMENRHHKAFERQTDRQTGDSIMTDLTKCVPESMI
jgi:hypothetical protein